MFKVIALMGKAGSGKDALLHELIRQCPDANEMISCTTRPIREGEIHGVNYFYMTPEEFGARVLNGEMLECTEFNNWFYGTSYEALRSDCINIGVFNPEGVEILQETNNIDLTVVYILAGDKVRLLRQLNREENPDCNEIVRRFGTDKKDFYQERIDAINPDYKILNNGDKTIELLAQEFAAAYNIG